VTKRAVVAGALVGLAVLAGWRRAAGRGVDWRARALERWQAAFERMPDDSPPKWMFRNITAIRRDAAVTRHNTDRILDLLQRGASGSAQPSQPGTSRPVTTA
jgi:hypothetical protein